MVVIPLIKIANSVKAGELGTPSYVRDRNIKKTKTLVAV